MIIDGWARATSSSLLRCQAGYTQFHESPLSSSASSSFHAYLEPVLGIVLQPALTSTSLNETIVLTGVILYGRKIIHYIPLGIMVMGNSKHESIYRDTSRLSGRVMSWAL